jgi:hypothetical protein
MARILVLTDRPQTDARIVSRAIELVHRLNGEEVSVVVTRGAGFYLTGGCTLSVPDSGLISPHSPSCWIRLPDSGDDAVTRQFLTRCRQEASLCALTCETARSEDSLRRTAALLGETAGLMVVTREAILDRIGNHESLRMLWREVPCPWLIYPSNAELWKRVVVAIRSDAQRHEWIAWGRHWSNRFQVPLALIELGSPPPRSLWSAAAHRLLWSSTRQHRRAVWESLLACGLGPGDLLLVDRKSAKWPHMTNCGIVSLDDLVAVAPCAVGVAPGTTSGAKCELLFPRGQEQVVEHSWDIMAA